MKPPTIYDIAEHLEISPSTVSRVLNNSSLIGNDTARRIRQTADQMGYKKRSIRRHSSRAILTIKLILPPRQQTALDLFYDVSDLISGIRQRHAERVNIVTDIASPALELFPHKKGGNVDGVIFAFNRPADRIYRDLDARGVPSLTLNRILPKRDYATCDHVQGMKDLLDVLVERHDALHPCFLTLTAFPDIARERERGFTEGCAERGITPAVRAIGGLDELSHTLAAELAREFNAVLCFNDLVALTLLQHAGDAAISITGFDNSPVRQLFISQPGTISMPVLELGKCAGDWIEQRLLNRDGSLFQKHLPGTYVAGTSLNQ
jgi:LacI family transcriptional regulator